MANATRRYLDYRQKLPERLEALSATPGALRRQRSRSEGHQHITGLRRDVAGLTDQRNEFLERSRTLSRQARSVASWQAAEYPTGEIIAPAVPPPASSSPQPVRNLLIAIILGGAAGTSFALLREHVNDRVRTRDEAARAANAPVLAALPKGSVPSTAKTQAVTLSAPEAMAARPMALHRNLAAEGSRPRRRLLVTSVEPGSSLRYVANLPPVAAPVRPPLRSRHLRILACISTSASRTSIGTGDPLATRDGLDASRCHRSNASASRRETSCSAYGTASVSPVRCSPAGLHHIFSLAAEMAQVLIIEAPPILSSDDALTLTAHADAVLLVLRAGVDKEGVTARAAAVLETTGAVLLGTVLHNAQKDDETVGWFERYQMEQEHLPASSPPDAEWGHARLGNGQRSTRVSVGDSSHEESTRLELGDHRPDDA